MANIPFQVTRPICQCSSWSCTITIQSCAAWWRTWSLTVSFGCGTEERISISMMSQKEVSIQILVLKETRHLNLNDCNPCFDIFLKGQISFIILSSVPLICPQILIFSDCLKYETPTISFSRAETSNYILQILWDVITCPCPWYLPLAQQSLIVYFTPRCPTTANQEEPCQVALV